MSILLSYLLITVSFQCPTIIPALIVPKGRYVRTLNPLSSWLPKEGHNIIIRDRMQIIMHQEDNLQNKEADGGSYEISSAFYHFLRKLKLILKEGKCLFFHILHDCTTKYTTAPSTNETLIKKHIFSHPPCYAQIPRGGSHGRPWKNSRMNKKNISITKKCEQRQTSAAKTKRTMTRKMNLYQTCLTIVLLWVAIGTIFYSFYNNWPLPQSFFYAVDAGMSIGFCTDVAETRIGSKAFTVVYILLGASCVGGALALFIQDIMEGIDGMRNGTFELLLARDAVCRADTDGTGRLSYNQFYHLVQEWTGLQGDLMTEEGFSKLCRKFDPYGKGYIEFDVFLKRFQDMDALLCTSGPLYSKRWYIRKIFQLWEAMKRLCSGNNRIFFVFLLWISMGVAWGRYDQGWDVITATHFAVSALATGGLTAPSVNSDGILPTKPALFCGFYCLFGIPLFALTLAHFARVLVEGFVISEEESAISKPIDLTEFELAKHLCTKDSVIHLSDFIVLQLLRQGKVSVQMINLIKAQFEKLDLDDSGVLPFDQATQMNHEVNIPKKESKS